MKISVFDLIHAKTQFFLTMKSSHKTNKASIRHIIIDHNASLVAIMPDSELVIKFIKARSWHEYLKLLWNHSRVTKEVKGSYLLTKLGLRIPEIYEVGYGIVPSTNHKYLGYYIMENLTQSGFQELSKLIKENALNKSLRETIMQSVHDGLKAMSDNRIIFSDFHLDNVFANEKGEVAWIDAGVTTYHSFNKNKFLKKHNHSIKRYINYTYSGQQLLLPAEKEMFSTLLLSTP